MTDYLVRFRHILPYICCGLHMVKLFHTAVGNAVGAFTMVIRHVYGHGQRPRTGIALINFFFFFFKYIEQEKQLRASPTVGVKLII